MKVLLNIIRIAFVAGYMGGHFFGLFHSGAAGPVIHTAFLFLIMVSFLRRKIPFYNYLLAIMLIAFYVYLYTTDIFNGPAQALGLHNKWWLYGAIYTLFITGFGINVLIKRRRDKYQVIRTISVISVQTVLAFSIPFVMFLFGQKEYYLSYFWPLKIEYFYPATIMEFPTAIILYSFLGSLILFPFLAILFGKRFYCSWVCGCGGLAETFGDRWRHLSNKSKAAWNFEKVSIHSVLFIAVAATIIIIVNWAVGSSYPAFSDAAFKIQNIYGFFISFSLAGAAGVGFYPVLGSRVWCRFFCPMAAMLGLIQKAGRFQVSVKDDMCISCGNCSTFCEMGIDVRSYASANNDFTRASCVGCGLCAHVCPRGVLRLENKKLFKKKDTELQL